MFTDSLYVFPAALPAPVVTVVMNLATGKKQVYDTDRVKYYSIHRARLLLS